MKLHEGNDALDGPFAGRRRTGARIIVADRMTGSGRGVRRLPELAAFVRVAVDVRNVDVDAASAAGVLVTRAGPGFTESWPSSCLD